MGRPSKEQLERALNAAEKLRDLDQDDDHLGRSLLYLNSRNEVLEKVFNATMHYLRSGHDQHEHTRLIQAVQDARRQFREESDSMDEDSDFGLE